LAADILVAVVIDVHLGPIWTSALEALVDWTAADA
jgi:hypothetical protein